MLISFNFDGTCGFCFPELVKVLVVCILSRKEMQCAIFSTCQVYLVTKVLLPPGSTHKHLEKAGSADT